MTTISSNSKVAYIYDEATDTWYPTAGLASTSANYSWTGIHNFSETVSFEESIVAKGGVNNFQNPTARDAAMTSPVANGTVVFVRQDDSGNTINQVQYYSGGSWIPAMLTFIDEKTSSYTLALPDNGKLIKVNSTSDLEITIPAQASAAFPIGSRLEVMRYGTGEVSIAAASGSGVTIRSKNNNKKISVQYSGAMLTKIGSDEWHLIGDLKA
jgi:hypothetical protein